VRDDTRVTTRVDNESVSASPLVRLPVRTRPVRKPTHEPKRVGSSVVILLVGACSAVALFDIFVLLNHFAG
jgi:hypothetical protein